MSIHSEPLPEFGGLSGRELGYGTDNDHDPTLDDEGIAGQHALAQEGLTLGPEETPES